MDILECNGFEVSPSRTEAEAQSNARASLGGSRGHLMPMTVCFAQLLLR